MISLTDEKRLKWSALIRGYIKYGRIPHRCLEKLIGRLPFSHTSLFGEFARAHMRPLYQKLHRAVYPARLSPFERILFGWWGDLVDEFAPRVAAHRPTRPHWRIYTDDSDIPPHALRSFVSWRSFAPSSSRRLFGPSCYGLALHVPKDCLIYGLELSALVLFFEDRAATRAGPSAGCTSKKITA